MFLLALFAVLSLNLNVISGTTDIKLTNIEKCDTKDESIPWSFKMTNIDADGYKSVDAEFDFTNNPFNDELSYTLGVDKLNDGDWEIDVYNDEGNLCDGIRQFVQKAWQKLMGSLEPRPLDLCNAEKGVYKLKDFQVLKQDIQMPAINGKLRARFNVFDKDDKNIFCTSLEVEVQK